MCFAGTWDMPRNIPPARPSYTARSDRAAESLKNFKETSPLNQAVNGYKEFTSKKVRRLYILLDLLLQGDTSAVLLVKV